MYSREVDKSTEVKRTVCSSRSIVPGGNLEHVNFNSVKVVF